MTDMKKTMKKSDLVIIFMLIIVFAGIIFMNTRLINRTMMTQVEQGGLDRLELLKYQYENVSADVEKLLMTIVYGADLMYYEEGSTEAVEEYIDKMQTLVFQQSQGILFRLYIAGPDWIYVPETDVPTGYKPSDQDWFKGAMDYPGKLYFADPYHDRITGVLCCTLSMRLVSHDGIVIGMDMLLSGVQEYISKMAGENNSKAMIVTDQGMIVGYNDANYAGIKLSAAFPEYDKVLGKIIKSSEDSNFFKVDVEGEEVTAIYSKMKNDWYMAVFLTDKDLYGDAIAYRWANIIVNILLFLFIVISFIASSRNRIKAQEALKSREAFIGGILNRLHDPLGNILRLSDMERFNNSNDIKADMADIKASGLQVKEMMDNLRSYSTIVSGETGDISEKKKQRHELAQVIKRFRNVIIVILILISGISMFFYVRNRGSVVRETVLSDLNDFAMELTQWKMEQSTILDMFTDIIESQPQILEDYDSAVAWLKRMSQNYESCSMCYIANPNVEHTIISNTGWVADEDFDFTERQWYKDAYNSYPNQVISEPYYEESGGNYCITIAQAMFDEERNYLGVFGIDVYLDKLVDIFDSEVYDNEYAFLVDSNGYIMNHPNKDYQMSIDNQVNITDTPYSGAFLAAYLATDTEGENVRRITDYDGTYSFCVCRMDSTKFGVVMVGKFWVWYREIIFYCIVYLVFIVASIIAVIILLNRVIRSQAEMNRELSITADRAMAAGQAKSDFLAQMSHEIRTPINAVIGMDEMILRENENPEIREYAENIKSASQTLLTLINGILDFSKIESGKMEILQVRYETLDMIDNLVNMISDRTEKKGLNLILNIDPTLPRSLFGDDVRIRQVVTNLLTNAVKYTQTGDITLSIWGSRGVGKEDYTLRVAVKDTGIGIKPEDMEKLFQSFQRLDEERNRNIEGTGLGMSIVQGLLSMMGSKLNVESEYGVGSTFSFEIEQKIIDGSEIGEYNRMRSREEHEKVPRKTLMIRDAEILVVDDNEMNLKVARGLLKRYGVVPDLCSSGRRSLDMIREKRYDLILMDHMMPGMDGVEALKEIRKQNLTPEDTPIIALTANAILGAREEYLAYGFKDYLSKPIDIEALEDMLIMNLPEDKRYYKEDVPEEAVTEAAKPAGQETERSAEAEAGISAETAETAAEAAADTADKPAEVKAEEALAAGVQAEEVSSAGVQAEEVSSAGMQAEEEGSFVDKLAAAGFNIEGAHSYTMDDDEFYLELLETYVNGAQEKGEGIKKFYDEKDWKNYQIAVHGLKSSSRTIGADRLADLAYEQELAAKEENVSTIDEGVDKLLEEFRKITEEIKGAIK